MTQVEQKQLAIKFLETFNRPDAKAFEELITEDFTFEIVSAFKEFPPIRGRGNFASVETATLLKLFPEVLKLKLGTIICDGPHVAVLAEADTVAANGRHYRQRYNFYLRFEGGKIAEGREYNDTNLIREVFLT